MNCFTCLKPNANIRIFNPLWISSYQGPIILCEKCKKFRRNEELFFVDEEAEQCFRAVREFWNYSQPNFQQLKENLLKQAESLRGNIYEITNLGGKVAAKLNGNNYLITLYTVLNFGSDDSWINRLDWR